MFRYLETRLQKPEPVRTNEQREKEKERENERKRGRDKVRKCTRIEGKLNE